LLLLIRHGQTEANAAGLIQGRRDPDLTPLGRRQAATLASAVPETATVVSSPLRRARQTAECLGRPVEIDERWVEVDYGDLEGRVVADVRGLLTRWQVDAEWAPAGGESLAAASRRVASACEELLPRFAVDDVVVVTHVGPIKAAVAWALGAQPGVARRMFVDLASITTVAIGTEGVPVLLSFNQRSHVAGLAV
jgi:broad specificity phosphatase PhoE